MKNKWVLLPFLILLIIATIVLAARGYNSNLKNPKGWRAFLPQDINDTITVLNGGMGQDGVLFAQAGSFHQTCPNGPSGPTPPSACSLQPQVAGTDFSIGNMTTPPGEFVVFGDGRPPSLQSYNWTPGPDKVVISLPDEYAIDVYVWVVFPGFDQQVAEQARDRTSIIWRNEKQGIRFSSFHILDRSQDSDLQDLQARVSDPSFSVGCQFVTDLSGNNRFIPHALNIYYVPSVASSSEGGSGSDYGTWCGGFNAIIMGFASSRDLLAHEIGHAFGLEHIDGWTKDFTTTNVMHSASSSRNFLTEGQTFRAVINSSSVINDPTAYHLGSSMLTCGSFTQGDINAGTVTQAQSDKCPFLEFKIWQDP